MLINVQLLPKKTALPSLRRTQQYIMQTRLYRIGLHSLARKDKGKCFMFENPNFLRAYGFIGYKLTSLIILNIK